ncbi:VWA domain-containing protein [Luteitalea sp. TBR-22]|uniref:VWA domain-containing protein n=1 Tax=Luteitalea sp. TBR-22 TaxID=2802971 RepID=UPI001EF569F5|nr:VWA domain-containing protein [Luteitalea sp. TBR-22]
MRPKRASTATIVVASLIAATSGPAMRLTAQEPAPLFRAVVEVVTIDAFVHLDGQPLAGLVPADFIVRDNGVEQRINAIGTTDSAHVIIGLDLSGSVDGDVLRQLRNAVRAVTGQLTARDRLSLFTFDDRLRVLARAEVPDVKLDHVLEGMAATGSTTLHDAVVLGSMLARIDQRPAAFLLFTDGADTSSWNTVTRATAVLQRTDVVVYPVGAGLPTTMITPSTTVYFQHPSWVAPTPGDSLRMLQVLADITGGEFLRVRRDARLAETFASILARYRQRYLLSFTPTGVGKRGWHRLDVRLRNRAGTVVAREGYIARNP